MLGLGNSLVTGGGVQGLIPSEISGLELHLKVNTGIVGNAGGASADGDMADGEDINSWADQSGRARHASQGTAGKKPHWDTATADFGAVHFEDASASMFMNLAQYSSADIEIDANEDFTIIIRAKVSDFSAARALIGGSGTDVIKFGDNTVIKTLIGGSGASEWEETGGKVFATDTYYIFTLTRSDGSTGNLEMRVHGGLFTDYEWDASSHTDADAFSLNNIAASSDNNVTLQGFIKMF